METTSDNTRVLIAYHDNCIDGFTSAVILMEALDADGMAYDSIAMKYTEASYQALINKAKEYKPNYIEVVDFSIPHDIIDKLSAIPHFTRGYITDHHKTAFQLYAKGMGVTEDSKLIAAINPQWDVVLDNAESGASLIMLDLIKRDCISPDTAERYTNLIKYVKDYDLWQYKYEDETRWVHHYLSNIEHTWENWRLVAQLLNSEEGRQVIFVKGAELRLAHTKQAEAAVGRAYRFNLDGYVGLITGVEDASLINDVGEALAKKSGTFGAVVPYFDPQATDFDPNKLISWSLRSIGDFDVSAIAKKFGGGGHKNAAGFTVTMQQTLDAILKEELRP